MTIAVAGSLGRTLRATVLGLGLLMYGCPGMAEQCQDCRSRSHTKDIGACKVCGGMTESGQFQLCMGCSATRGECERCRRPLSNKQVPESLCLRVKVLADHGVQPIDEEWILKELKKLKAPESVGVRRDWFVMGSQPMTLHDSKHFGRLVLHLADHGTGSLRVEFADTHHLFLELSSTPGTRCIVRHTLQSTVASTDLYLVFEVHESLSVP